MDEDIRLRAACDRCHSQKLRCPKRPGSEVCDRCSKSGALCVYSPFRQKKEAEAQIRRSDKDFGNKKDNCGSVRASQKRQRIASLVEEPNIDLGDAFGSAISNQDEESIDIGANWSYNSYDTFRPMVADPSFVDMGLVGQDELPQLDFTLPALPKYADKMDNVLQLCNPPFDLQSRGLLCSHKLNPVEPTLPSPSQPLLAVQTPKIPSWNGHSKEQPQQRSATHCIRQLSELSVSLFEHSNTIPPQSIHDPIPENEVYEEAMSLRAQDYAYYTADETFRVTQELIDIYPSFIELFARRNVSLPEESEAQTSPTGDQRVDRLGPIIPNFSNPERLDHASILLILSCHLRLLDIYDELFKHMEVCIEQRGIVCNPRQATFSAPQLKIGNFTPPVTAAVSMQILMLVHFATSLCDYAVELDRQVQDSENGCANGEILPSDQGGDGARLLSVVSSRQVKERASAMLQHLSSLRALMLREGLMA
ncbi:Isoflavipucine cluster transcription factor [Hyphodiscus hymeniophilus]|uniref:Isoflavipucine cluster transcription factor n=1 Tax=Hyphodiscus hymeniophilus TaxID=353542 RepID=A0A9P7AVW3_9HELO|nr:Isoflavipucine cluster transcription factor [Hyphodiscus hymeniophilus]